MAQVYNIERISNRTWKIVEDDTTTQQYPFIYVIEALDKFIIIDTGCGNRASLFDFIAVNFDLGKRNKRILIVCTHIHFDHIGGVKSFLYAATKNRCEIIDVCLSGRHKVFSNNTALSSLAVARGIDVSRFKVTRWLEDGEFIWYHDDIRDEGMGLQVVYTPGHTPDSIALVSCFDPYTAVHVDCLGSNYDDYKASLVKMNDIVEKLKGKEIIPDNDVLGGMGNDEGVEGGDSVVSTQYTEELNMLCVVLNVVPNDVLSKINFDMLMELCGYNLQTAIDAYISNSPILSACPAKQTATVDKKWLKASENVYDMQYNPTYGDISLSCGHVEANLNATAISEILTELPKIEEGRKTPSKIDGEYAEYTIGNYTVILPRVLY